jgi:hypothetical protein
MDDPWGSPWTTVEPAARKQSTSSALEPPPRAFLSTSPTFTLQSPWADDNDNRDWSAGDGAASPNGWGGVWANGDSHSQSNGHATPGHDEPKREGMPAWPTTPLVSPGLKAIALPQPASLSRNPSPDPWSIRSLRTHSPDFAAADRSTTDQQQESPIRIRVTPDERLNPLDSISAPVLSLPQHEFEQSTDPWGDMAEPESRHSDDQPESSTGSSSAHDEVAPPLTPPQRANKPMSEDEPETDEEIEELEQLEAPNSQQKAASKVQGLVDMYDGLSRRKVSPTITPSSKVYQSPGQELTPSKHPARVHAEDSDDSDASIVDDATKDTHPASVESSVDKPRTFTENTSEQALQQHIPFSVDLGYLDELFPNAKSAAISSSELPDHIIRDTFSSISERKTWYRISRTESMRQQNAGDENYVRISWAKSIIREDSLYIIRRWMEESSVSGRVFGTRVGRSNSSHMFGWDSSTPAIGLDEVFAPRHNYDKTSKPASLPSPTLPPPTTWNGVSPSHTGSEVAASSFSFGWSSTPAVDPTPSLDTNPTTTPDRGHGRQSSLDSLQPVPKQIALARSTTTQPISIAEEADEDDWGDMMSSSADGPTDSTNDSGWDSIFNQTTPVTNTPNNHDQTHSWTTPTTSKTPNNPTIEEANSINFHNTNPEPVSVEPPLPPVASQRPPTKKVAFIEPNSPTGSQPASSKNKKPLLAQPEPVASKKARASTMQTHREQSKPATEEAGIAQKIIAELPDLSYMLQ